MASKVGSSFLDGQNYELHYVGDALVGSSGAQKTQKEGVLDNLSDSPKPSLTRASEKKPSLTQESKKKHSRTQEFKKKPSLTQESKKKPSLPQESKKKPSLTQESKKKPSLAQESKKKPSLTQESKKKPSLTQESKKKPSLAQESKKKLSLTQESKKKPSLAQASKKKPSEHFIQSNASNEEALDEVQNPLMVMDSAAERFLEEFFAEEEYDPHGKRLLNPEECGDPIDYLDRADIMNFLLTSQPDLNSQLNPDECEDPMCKYGALLDLL